VYLAMLLRAAVSFTGFGAAYFHRGEDYSRMTSILNIDQSLPWSVVIAKYPSLKSIGMSLQDIVRLHQNGSSVPCNTAVISTIRDCPPTNWCISQYPEHDFFSAAVQAIRERKKDPRARCMESKVGFPLEFSVIRVVFHVRTGDLCMHCRDVKYYENILDVIERSIRRVEGDGAESYSQKAIFHSKDRLPELEERFPSADFKYSGSIESTSCDFLTSDIFIAGGSSFGAIVLFSLNPFWPLVFEDIQKEFNPSAKLYRSHVYPINSSVPLMNGAPILSDDLIDGRMKKLMSYRRAYFSSL
jgi:hypothetical protein